MKDQKSGPSTVWRRELKAANKVLRTSSHLFLQGKRCRLRVKPRANEHGQHAIDLDGLWQAGSKETSRRLHTPVVPSDLTRSFERALKEAEQLIAEGQLGRDTRRQFKTHDRTALKFSGLSHQNQLKKAKTYVLDRGKTKGVSDKTLKNQLRWIDLCFCWAAETHQSMSLQVCCDALIDLYGDRSRASYKKSVECMRFVCQHIDAPIGIEENQKSAYSYQPKQRTKIPTDDVIWKRIQGIKDKDLQKHIYAIAVYGHRIMQIYSTDWSTYDKESGYVQYWSTKNNYICCGVPCPFGKGRWIDLSDWLPENFEELYVTGERPKGHVELLRDARSAQLSNAIKKHLGVTATDLRHRYCSVSLMNGLHTATTCAAAVGNSSAMIEKTYAREIALYMYRKARGE